VIDFLEYLVFAVNLIVSGFGTQYVCMCVCHKSVFYNNGWHSSSRGPFAVAELLVRKLRLSINTYIA